MLFRLIQLNFLQMSPILNGGMYILLSSESELVLVVGMHFPSPWYDPLWLTGRKTSTIYLSVPYLLNWCSFCCTKLGYAVISIVMQTWWHVKSLCCCRQGQDHRIRILERTLVLQHITWNTWDLSDQTWYADTPVEDVSATRNSLSSRSRLAWWFESSTKKMIAQYNSELLQPFATKLGLLLQGYQ